MVIRYGDPDEWLKEFRGDRAEFLHRDHVVRVTLLSEEEPHGRCIVTLVAGYLNPDSDLVEVRTQLATFNRLDEQRALQIAREVQQRFNNFREAVLAVGADLRGGVFRIPVAA